MMNDEISTLEEKSISKDKSKDELIDELMKENKRIYKKSIFVFVFSFMVALMGTHYGYKQAEKDLKKEELLNHLKVYNFLQDKIDELDYPLQYLLTTLNDFEYELMDNAHQITDEDYLLDINNEIDEAFTYFQNDMEKNKVYTK